MRYDEGETPGLYAFFDGTSSDYRKALKRDDMIVGYKIAAITAESVTLVQDTNSLVLKIGMQLRNDGAGHWYLADGTTLLAGNSYGNYSSNGRRRGGNFRFDPTAPETPGQNGSDTNAVDVAGGPDMPPDQGTAGDTPPGADPGTPPDNGTPPTLSVPAGPASDALQRLIQLRQQEEQQTGSRN